MENLEILSKKSEVTLDEVAHMVRLIGLEHPGVQNPILLQKLIKENFNVDCEVELIGHYLDLDSLSEDFELESRRHEYGFSF